jgi:uncharacterized membrane protein YhaH (DUF805 family)
MNFNDSVKSVFNNYSNFNGRARRSEYWWFVLFTMIVNIFLNFLPSIIGNIFSVAIFIPSLAVLIRRLHDTGKSGWYSLIIYLPLFLFIGFFVYVFSKVGLENLKNPDPEIIKNAVGPNALIFLVLFGIVFLIAAIYMLVLLCTDSQPGENEYGPNPKNPIDQNEIEQIGSNQL